MQKATVVVVCAAVLFFLSGTGHAAPAGPAPAPAWITKSNANAQVLMQAQLPFQPERASFLGIPGFDDLVTDLGPKREERFRSALARARSELERRRAAEDDRRVREDLDIMLRAADLADEGSVLEERLLVPWVDVAQVIFRGQQALLRDQVQPERRAKALERLLRYVGKAQGSAPFAVLARARYEERMGDAHLLRPTKLEVEQALANVPTYVAGIRKLYTQFHVAGADDALAALDQQTQAWADWVRAAVLPTARADTRLPPELYAHYLKGYGIDIAPTDLVARAQLEFMETRAAMQALAPQVAKAKGLKDTAYVDVLRALKTKQLERKSVEPYYRKIIAELEQRIGTNHVVDLPKRPMHMRLASDAESAAQPAPHFDPAPLVDNTGQEGEFVLTTGNPSAATGKGEAYDDFNYEGVAWSLAAHEGRPGHELQFTAIVERGVSLARSVFAFNAVNVEGWALYAEAEMLPYEPIDGQFCALQLRLLRAARAMLDPMLNLGLIERERANAILVNDVGLSAPMARQELDRYTFRMPAQAGAYFYGYTRILQLRMETELALGPAFDRQAFNNFLLDQGLLPPDLLAAAVRGEFVPARIAH